ncbi:MAG: glycoside hydrolase family 3 protein [Selenomonadaceae bacterium]|nr:glycoside hydrolase family 3 protein [Selenomonadaceae bacterium]
MKLKFLNLMMIFVTAVICGCSSGETTPAADKAEAVTEDPVEKILQSMTLAEKVGQMVMIGVHGNSVNDDSRYMLTQYHIGGVIFFDRNLETRAQAKSFADDLNKTAAEKVPLFFAIDEEGGIVARMKHEITPPPSQAEIGRSGDSSQAYRYANSVAQDLKSIGVNVNFAPVADVGTRDTRSFSDNENVVAEFVDAAARGYEDAGIFYCLKHFPGIGLGVVDSHVEVSTIDASREILETIDLVPFRKIIAAHDNSRFMVMVGHLRYSALDAGNSASVSPAVMKILRDELGFSGVIITDDLEMGAIANHSEFKDVGVAAIKAGADIALICHEYPHETDVYLGILNAVERGEISEERINESVRRILKMKLALS